MKQKKTKLFYLQNLFKNRISLFGCFLIICAGFIGSLLPKTVSAQIVRKSHITLMASDSLVIDADKYQSKKSFPYLILLHQEESSKEEFDSLIPHFVKMNLNCLAINLRSGNSMGYFKNETASRARENGIPSSFLDASRDIDAAIKYLYEATGKPVSLFGSESSATLALLNGKNNDHVRAIVAFNPGDYFAPEYSLKNILDNYTKPFFIATSENEFDSFQNLTVKSESDKVIFKSSSSIDIRGSKALLKQNPNQNEYWLSLLLFFRSLQ